MSAAKRSRSSYVTDNADNVAVTNYQENVYTFRWNVKNFRERMQFKETGIELFSPVFKNPKDNSKGRQWKLSLEINSVDYFSIRVYLVNFKTETNFRLQLDLLNSKNSYRKVTSNYTFDHSGDKFCAYQFVKLPDLLKPENELLEDDTFKINCQITEKTISTPKLSSEKAKSEMQAAIRKNYIVSDVAKLFNSPTLSDVFIETKSVTLNAHKAILSCRSSVFSAIFNNEKPELDETVEILDYDHDVVNAMLQYIYCGETVEDIMSRKFQEMFRIAITFNIKGLKEDVGQYMTRRLSLENVGEILITADKYAVPNLKSKAITFFNMNKDKLVEETEKIMKYKPALLLELYHQTI